MAVDAARTALRLKAGGVTLVWQKQRSQMGAQSARVDEAEHEGVMLCVESEPASASKLDDSRIRLVLKDGRTLDARTLVAALDRKVDLDALKAMGLPVAKKGVQADRATGATGLPGVFASGECVLGATYGVRAVASARDAAMSIDRFLRGENVTPPHSPINCRMGRLSEEELAIIRRTADTGARVKLSVRSASGFGELDAGLSDEQARGESRRCLQCGCLARDDCALRINAGRLGARPNRFKGPHRAFARDETHAQVVYEPNKCILCGLCIRAAAEQGERLGLTFVDRGFAATAAVPFERTLADGLQVAGEACVRICPTGALAFKLDVNGESAGPHPDAAAIENGAEAGRGKPEKGVSP
jgi:formate dehydrogenase major subunit